MFIEIKHRIINADKINCIYLDDFSAKDDIINLHIVLDNDKITIKGNAFNLFGLYKELLEELDGK